METKQIIEFKLNEIVVLVETKQLSLAEIENLKLSVTVKLNCRYEDIQVVYVEVRELSDVDVTSDGMFDWKDATGKYLTGINLPFEIGSDEYLDAIVNNSLADYLEFT